MPCFMGLDISTTSAKAIIIDEEGTVLAIQNALSKAHLTGDHIGQMILNQRKASVVCFTKGLIT